MLWKDFDTYVRSAVLNATTTTEDGTTTSYSPEQMLIWARWACAEISMTFAQPWRITYPINGKVYAKPDDMLGSTELEALLTYQDSRVVRVLSPLERMPDDQRRSDHVSYRYYEWPVDTINLDFEPASGSTLTLDYFRMWPAPQGDNSDFNIPRWLELPFAYLIGAYAMSPFGVQSAIIRQWNTRLDSGNPVDNTLHSQARFFIDQAYRLLKHSPPQDRSTFFANRRIGIGGNN